MFMFKSLIITFLQKTQHSALIDILLKKLRLVSCYNKLLLSWIIVRDYRVLKVDCCCSDSQRSIDVYTGYDRIQDNKNATTAVFFTNKYLNKQL